MTGGPTTEGAGEWVDVIAVARLNAADVTPVQLGSLALAVHDTTDGIHITQALCSHAGARLCDGYLDGYIIECPLHQGCFDVRNGKALYAPATRALRTYPVRLVDGTVQTRLPTRS